jgi:hypothetical protein
MNNAKEKRLKHAEDEEAAAAKEEMAEAKALRQCSTAASRARDSDGLQQPSLSVEPPPAPPALVPPTCRSHHSLPGSFSIDDTLFRAEEGSTTTASCGGSTDASLVSKERREKPR